MRVDTKIIFEMFDTDSKSSAVLACDQCQTDVETLKNETADTSRYATTEPKGFLLDGSYKILTDMPTGLYSNKMSMAGGLFRVPVVLAIVFSSPVTSSGITLYFPQDEYPSDVDISWYDGENKLKEARYSPDSTVYFCKNNVENYNRITLSFYGTKVPQHYLKLRGIDFGQSLQFSADKIIKSNVIQDISILCDEISVNALEFEVEDKDRLFSVVSSNSIFFAVQESQKIIIYSNTGNGEKKLGVFYLKNLIGTGVRARFIAQDAIGVMDGGEEVSEKYYDTTFEQFCGEIMAGVKFTIEESLKNKPIKGYLTTCSRREALQQACFAVGAVADTAGGDIVRIFTLPAVPAGLITPELMYSGGRVESIVPTRYLSVTAHNFDNDGIDEPTVYITELNSKAKGTAEVSDAVFVNKDNVQSVIDRLTDYYNRKVLYSFKMPLDTLYRMGDMLMSYMDSSYIKGNITSMDINPSGGMVANVTIKGYVFNIEDGIFAGEVYTGERGVI